MFIRRLPRFEYLHPKSFQELFSLVEQYRDKAKFIAGGTDLLISMKRRELTPEHVINLKEISELKGFFLVKRKDLG